MRVMPFMKRKKGVQFAGVGLDAGGSGTTDYTELSNKPQIAGVTLTGNKTLADLGIQGAIQSASFTDTTNADGQFSVGSFNIATHTIVAIKPASNLNGTFILPYVFNGRYYATAFFVSSSGTTVQSNFEVSGTVYYIDV